MGYDERDASGYEFSLRWPAETSGEMVEKRFITIAKSKDDAATQVRKRAPKPCSAQLLSSGPPALKRAEDLGMKDGDVEDLK